MQFSDGNNGQYLCLFSFIRIPFDRFEIRFELKTKKNGKRKSQGNENLIWIIKFIHVELLKWQTTKQPQHFNDDCNWQYHREEKFIKWKRKSKTGNFIFLLSCGRWSERCIITIIIIVNACMHYYLWIQLFVSRKQFKFVFVFIVMQFPLWMASSFCFAFYIFLIFFVCRWKRRDEFFYLKCSSDAFHTSVIKGTIKSNRC